MNIDKYLDVIGACRFCFMCRHLSANGLALGREADTPRSHALIADLVRMDKATLKNADYVQCIYASDLSGANRKHCFGYHAEGSNNYDEIGLQLALRQDIVEAGCAPADVVALKDELAAAEFTVEGSGDVLFYKQPFLTKYATNVADAFNKLAPAHKTISGGECGAALATLGFAAESKAVADKFAAAVKASGCSKLVVAMPSVFAFCKALFDGKGIAVLTSAEYLASLKPAAKSGKITFIDSDFYKFYSTVDAPKKALLAAGYEVEDFGTNPEESYACGEGSMVQFRLFPEIAKALAQRVARFAKAYKSGTIVTASPYTQYVLGLYAPDIKVLSIEEALA